MPLDIDCFDVLARIGANEKIFTAVRSDAAKAARALVVKRLKAKGISAQDVRALQKAIGLEAFSLIVDGMTASELKSVLTKLDKHNSQVKEGTEASRRTLLRELAQGSADPVAKPVASKRKKVQRLQSAAMAAVRRRD
jgi:hypothetical protein